MTFRTLAQCVVLSAIAALAVCAALPAEATEAHRYADAVLMPRLSAAMNDWWYQHPRDPEGKEGQHCRGLDAADVRRWRTVREQFRELDAAMKRAGY
jgi:hypothetical protein